MTATINALKRRRVRGFSLLEVMVSLAIIGIVVVAFMGGLGTATKSTLQVDVRTSAENLAVSAMESVKAAPYVYAPGGGVADYPVGAPPTGYQISTLDRSGSQVADHIYGVPWDISTNDVYGGVSPIDPGLQKVTVVVAFEGAEIFRLTDLKRTN